MKSDSKSQQKTLKTLPFRQAQNDSIKAAQILLHITSIHFCVSNSLNTVSQSSDFTTFRAVSWQRVELSQP